LAWLQSLEPARKKHVLEPVRTFIVRWHKTPDGRVDRTTSNLSFFPGMKPVASENLIVTAASDEIRNVISVIDTRPRADIELKRIAERLAQLTY
jgi:hypothetical protein